MTDNLQEFALPVQQRRLRSHAIASFRVVDEYSEFESIHEEWNALVEHGLSNSLFLRHEWFDAAWQWRKQDSVLSVLAVYKNGSLIGICPLVIRKYWRRVGTFQSIEFLTVPDTQFCDIIACPAAHAVVVDVLSMWLGSMTKSWDKLDLRYFPETSCTPKALCRALARSSIGAFDVTSARNHFIVLNTSWAEFYRTRSRRLKKSNNLAANRLERAGKVKLEWVRDSKRAPQALKAVVTLSTNSWKSETSLTLDNTGPRAFIERLNTHAAARDWLSVWILYLDDVPIAAEYQVIYRNQVYALRADFSETHRSLSPGTYLNWKLLEGLFESGHDRYYLGRGDNLYKLRWTNTADELINVSGYRKGLHSQTVRFLEQYARPILGRACALLQHPVRFLPSKRRH
jgi:CelD/BcsL family acetyltransferase involved in cellulose biosynthesis